MKLLPTLYSRTSTGAVQQWTVQIDGNKFRVEAGQTDGKKVLSEWTVCESKNVGRANATTPVEQALSEAQAKWDKKAKTGYTTDINKIDTCTSYVEPMLAKDFEDYEDKLPWSKGVLVQNKYNGVRCTATFEGGAVVLKSRKGELWVAVPHINKDLEKFFEKHPDAVLDGELYNYDLRQKLNELTKIVRKTKAKELTPELFKRSEEIVRFYIYDGYGFDGWEREDDYMERKAWIDDELAKFSKYYRRVPTEMVFSKDELDAIYNKYLADGEEGAIIRLPKSAYENKRSKNLLKYKPEHSAEARLKKLHEGTGNWAGTAKTATLVREEDGVEFDATFKGTFEQGVERLKNPQDWEGQLITYLFTGFTGLGVPNYARIDPDNCFSPDR
jgi:ATP-dependent DNA ligase